MIPSFLSLVFNGLLLLIVTIFILYKLYQQYRGNRSFDTYQLAVVLIGLTIAYGVHGLLHAEEEKLYNFNPLEGRWTPTD